MAALGALATVLVVVGIVVASELPGSSKGASQGLKGGGSTAVERRDLVATDTESGTLSYANPQTVFNRLSGTITSLPQIGQVIKPGQTLYNVDGSPVVLFNGTVPAYRTLSEAVTDGADVLELKQGLVALGFDPEHLITINDTFDAATASAVELWQASLGESETGTVTLGQIVFLPGAQRITAVDSALGSTGGSAGSGTGSSGTGASYVVPAGGRPEFVSLTTTSMTPAKATRRQAKATKRPTKKRHSRKPAVSRPKKPAGGRPAKGGKMPTTLAALLALLKAETLELRKSGVSPGAGGSAGTGSGSAASRSSSASSRSGSGSSGSGTGSSASGSGSGASGTSGSGSSGSSGAASSSGSGAGASAQEILQTTSTQLIVSVDLDATKQSEAVVGEPVTVQLPDGSTVDGKITHVSAVATTSSSSSGSSGSGASGAGGSSTPSATIPVTITLKRHRHIAGLDQAAVSVNFQQQVENHVLSVPVTALLATAGGGYAVQEAAAPHQLIPVTPGLFAAGYVQISGSQINPGLQVTDSQG